MCKAVGSIPSTAELVGDFSKCTSSSHCVPLLDALPLDCLSVPDYSKCHKLGVMSPVCNPTEAGVQETNLGTIVRSCLKKKKFLNAWEVTQ